MSYQCPFDHQTIPLPPEIAGFLEASLWELFLPRKENTHPPKKMNEPNFYSDNRTPVESTDYSNSRRESQETTVRKGFEQESQYENLDTSGKKRFPEVSDQLQITTLVYHPIVQVFQPWARDFQEVIGTSRDIRSRICHDAIDYVSKILVQTDLADQLDNTMKELRGTDPKNNPGYPNQPLAIRVSQLLSFQHSMDGVHEKLSRGVMRILQRTLPSFLNELLNAARLYRTAERQIQNAFGKSLGLWDLQPGNWQKEDSRDLEIVTEALLQNQGLSKMLGILGQRAQKSSQDIVQEQTPLPFELQSSERALGKQELVGIQHGRDFESLLPQQLALLRHPFGKYQFFAKYADQKLIQWEYQTRNRLSDSLITESTKSKKAKELGPFILCVDTSGSMAGKPEIIAKAVCLAAAKLALETNRGLSLVSFSDKTQVLHWNPKIQYADFLNFLSYSFRGGTDLQPAIEESVALIQNNNFENADLLIVSDFRIPKIMVKKSNKLRHIQTHFGTRIHGLTIGREPIIDDYHLFDTRWHFHIDSHPFGESLVETN